MLIKLQWKTFSLTLLVFGDKDKYNTICNQDIIVINTYWKFQYDKYVVKVSVWKIQ